MPRPLAAPLLALLLLSHLHGSAHALGPVAALMLAGSGLTILGGLNSGGCPLFKGADKCACRNMFLTLVSGTSDGKEVGPVLQYQPKKLACRFGTQCALGHSLIRPGDKGGVQVGNSDNTYLTGSECRIYYKALIDGYDNCLLQFYLDNPFTGSNEFNGDIVNTTACPKSLSVSLNQYVGGNREAGVEYVVYYDKNKDGRPGGGPLPVKFRRLH